MQDSQPALNRFPDFLGIGTTRGGTTWLYISLSRHPDVWMPPVKELNYFNKLQDGVRTIGICRKRVLAVRVRDYLFGERKVSTGDSLIETLKWDYQYFLRRRSEQWYRELFRPREGQLTGEITPAYAIIPPEQVERVNRLNPKVKAIYILRDPVERAWSSTVNHLARKQGRKMDKVPYSEILKRAEYTAKMPRAWYAANIRKWRAVIGAERLFIGYMEEIQSNPRELLSRICQHLQIPAPPPEADRNIGSPVNTSRHYGTEMPPEIRYIVSRELLPIMEDTAELLGGYAVGWLERAKAVVAAGLPDPDTPGS